MENQAALCVLCVWMDSNRSLLSSLWHTNKLENYRMKNEESMKRNENKEKEKIERGGGEGRGEQREK